MLRLGEELKGCLIVGFYAGLGLGLLELAVNGFYGSVYVDPVVVVAFLSDVMCGVLLGVFGGFFLSTRRASKARYDDENGAGNVRGDARRLIIISTLAFLAVRSYLSLRYGTPHPFSIMGLATIAVEWVFFPKIAAATFTLAGHDRIKSFHVKDAAIIVVLLTISAGAFYLKTHSDENPGDRPNVLIIVADALRADHVGAYGYLRNTTPNADALAREGVLFKTAYTVAPKTNPAVSSIMTGLYPQKTGVRSLFNTLDPGQATLAQTMRKQGYHTAAFVRNHVLNGSHGMLEGFEDVYVGYEPATCWLMPLAMDKLVRVYVWLEKKITGRNARPYLTETSIMFRVIGVYEKNVDGMYTDKAVRWLRANREGGFFMYIHYLKPHWPYDPPAPYDRLFGGNFSGRYAVNNFDGHMRMIHGGYGAVEQLPHALALYDGEIALLDENVGSLVGALREIGVYNDTMIVFMSDHGEAFGDHGNVFFEHGETVYEEEVRIPLIIKLPDGGHADMVVDSPVSVVDVMPTIAEVVGAPAGKVDGISLGRYYGGGYAEDRALYLESNVKGDNRARMFYTGSKGKWRGLVYWPWKLILIPHPDGDILELYDIKKDPRETTDLSQMNANVTKRLESQLRAWMAEDPLADDETPENFPSRYNNVLKSLGYLA